MRDGFAKYGLQSRQYPLAALEHSAAVIFTALGIEKGTPARVAERFRKRLARAGIPSPLT